MEILEGRLLMSLRQLAWPLARFRDRALHIASVRKSRVFSRWGLKRSMTVLADTFLFRLFPDLNSLSVCM